MGNNVEHLETKKIQDKAKRGASLARRFYKETGTENSWEESPGELIEWLVSIKTDESISNSTFKNYRRWLAFFCEENGHRLTGQRIRQVGKKHRANKGKDKDIFVDLEGNEITKKKKTNQSESALYAAKISEAQVKEMGQVLVSKNIVTGREKYSSGKTALGALRCSMMLGLRPIEWKSVKLKDTVICDYDGRPYNYVVEIQNAKLKEHQKKTDPENNIRRLIISNFSDADYHFVRAFIGSVPKADKEFKAWYDQIRKAILRAQNHLIKYSPQYSDARLSLYSGRHIFASEARRQGSDKFNLAALLGHTNTQNQSYYGDTSGTLERKFDLTTPKPWPGESRKVREAEANQL